MSFHSHTKGAVIHFTKSTKSILISSRNTQTHTKIMITGYLGNLDQVNVTQNKPPGLAQTLHFYENSGHYTVFTMQR